MSRSEVQPTGDERLARELVEAFVASSSGNPVLPAGGREEAIALLVDLLADRDRFDAYVAALRTEQRRRGVSDLVLNRHGVDLDDDQLAAGAFKDFSDDQLADIAISPDALRGIRDFLDDPDSHAGSWYFDGILKVEAARPGADDRARRAREITDGLRNLGLLGGDTPSPRKDRARRSRLPFQYRRILVSSGAAAAALLLLVTGILIGTGRREPPLGASITVSEVPTRGGLSDTILEVKNTSDRRAFVAVVGLLPDQGAALHYRESQQFIDIAPNATRVIQSLPKQFDGAASFLIVVSPYPLGETVREIARAGLPDSDAEQARVRLQGGLEGYGHRGFSIQVVRPAPRVR